MRKDPLEVALQLFDLFCQKNKEILGDRKGIYLAGIHQFGNFYKIHGGKIGILSTEKAIEKASFALEKISRVLTDKVHYTSFPTQDYLQRKFGGCIKTTTFVLSASGFPPECDHTFVLEVLKQSGHCQDQEYRKIQEEFERYKNKGRPQGNYSLI